MSTLSKIAINEYKLSLVQQRWVVEHALTAARRHQHVTLVSAFEGAARTIDDALTSEAQYLAERGVRPDGQDAVELDRSLDALVTVVHGALTSRAALGDLMPHARKAAELVKLLFPSGLRGHVQATHATASIKNDRLVKVLRDPAWGDVTTALALGPVLDRISELNAVFGRVLHPERTMTGEEMEDIRDAALDATLRAFYLAAAILDPADATQLEQRDDVLRPLMAMNKELSRTYKRRNQGAVVTPDAVVPDALDPAEAMAPETTADTPMGSQDVAAGAGAEAQPTTPSEASDASDELAWPEVVACDEVEGFAEPPEEVEAPEVDEGPDEEVGVAAK